MALLLTLACWVRFAQVAAGNRPPLRLLALEGEEDWPDREVLRARCGFNGQFLAVGERVWIPCAPAAGRWELIRWDFSTGVAQRRWRARTSPKDSSSVEVLRQSGLHVPPVVAAALQLPVGDLALVLHAPKPLTPVELVVARREGGLSFHPLPVLKPGALVGFAYAGGRYELLTADCRRHVFEPGKPLVSSPLPGCPYDGRTVLEWAQHTALGWRFVYAQQAVQPGRYVLYRVEPGTDRAQRLTTLSEGDDKRRGEKLDMTPGNVLPVARSQQPTHRIHRGSVVALPAPPPGLVTGLNRVSPGGAQVVLVKKTELVRLHTWHGLNLGGSAGSKGARTIHRWRWLMHLPDRWIGGERAGHGKTLRLVATAPARQTDLQLPRAAPTVLYAIGARRGGLWLFDSHGRYLHVDHGLRRTDTPGLSDRLTRLWRLHHLQRTHLTHRAGRVDKRSLLTGHAHRAALPVVLLGLPLGSALLLPWIRRAGRRRDPKRPLRGSLRPPAWPWLAAAGIYLVAAGALLWSFWQVTAAL